MGSGALRHLRRTNLCALVSMYRRVPYYLLVLLLVDCTWTVQAQPASTLATYENLGFRLRVKQFDEFIDRFNNAKEGLKALYSEETGDTLTWPKALGLLRGPNVDAETMADFANDVVSGNQHLDFYDDDWYAADQCTHAT